MIAMHFLSGLPRSGSTLLSALLSQNPDIHAEGNSAVCQIMWDAQQSCEGSASEQLRANRRARTQDDVLRAIPWIYYKDVTASHIVDKCRSWTLPDNMEMIRRYLTPDPKVIVLLRPLDEVFQSFARLRVANGLSDDVSDLMTPGTEPVMRSHAGAMLAHASGDPAFLFIEYADLCDDPAGVLERIYAHCGWEPFAHDFDHVVNRHPEDDGVYGLVGMHSIREKVGR